MSVSARNTLAGLSVGAGSITPSTVLETTYYLGVYDQRDQLPPTLYRIRVRGQSSVFNNVSFASGWLPATVVDSITGTVKGNPDDATTPIEAKENGTQVDLATGRGLMLFGPEGFREAPRAHRLVIYMGSSPAQVEAAFAEALGTVATLRQGQGQVTLDADVFAELSKAQAGIERYKRFETELGGGK
ncbi:MAG: hypothetical protein R3E87_10300 [Burkholderiaceae bacterium]